MRSTLTRASMEYAWCTRYRCGSLPRNISFLRRVVRRLSCALKKFRRRIPAATSLVFERNQPRENAKPFYGSCRAARWATVPGEDAAFPRSNLNTPWPKSRCPSLPHLNLKRHPSLRSKAFAGKMESPLLKQTLHCFQAAIFRPSRPVSNAVARRARPLAHLRRPSTCSLINLLNGMKSFSSSATDRSVGSFRRAGPATRRGTSRAPGLKYHHRSRPNCGCR